MKTLDDLLEVAGVSRRRTNTPVAKIAVDSRALDADTWWLAARGISHHALDFYDPKQPCAGILYEPPYPDPPQGAIAVVGLRRKISAIADVFYDHPSRKLCLIGVTGTDGKSSLVHYIAQGLDAAMLGTIGYGKLGNLRAGDHTTPDALSVQRQLSAFADTGCATVAMEISSHALDQGRVAAVAIDIAVFSNLSRDHLDYHHTMEAYFLAKASLFARPVKHALINIDDSYGRRLIEEKRIHPAAEIWAVSSRGRTISGATHLVGADSFSLADDGISLLLDIDSRQAMVRTCLLARFNIDNLLNVAACLAASGHDFPRICAILENLRGVPGRVERVNLGQGRTAIVDYAHTEGAIVSVLCGVRPHVKGRLWIVFGCGGDRDRGKRPLMAQAAERYADVVVITDDNPRSEDPEAIIAQVVSGLEHPQKAHIVRPRDAAIAYALERLSRDDTVLIAGKGHETYQIVATVKQPFSDREEIDKWLKK